MQAQLFLYYISRYTVLSSARKLSKCLPSVLVVFSLHIGNEQFMNHPLRKSGLDAVNCFFQISVNYGTMGFLKVKIY